jgi:hypothetical protein
MEIEPILLLHQEQAALQEIKLIDSRNSKGLFGRHSFCIEIAPDTTRLAGFLAEPYIKLGNGNDTKSSTGVLRIQLRDAKVIYHKGPSLKVTTSLLNDLNIAMTYTTKYNGIPCTVLECINLYLTDLSKQYGYAYTPVLAVDFTKATGYRKNGGDYKLC